MSNKCNNYGARIISKPIWKGQEIGEKFSFDKIIWKNLIIGDWTLILILLSLLFVIWAYQHDTAACREAMSKPCDFVKANQEACYQIEQRQNKLILISEPPLKS